MNLELFIARRYLSTQNKPFFLTLLSFISFLGMSTSVFALLFVLAVMRGFETDFQNKVIGFKAPLTITGSSELSWEELARQIQTSFPEITSVHPYVEGEAVIQTEAGDSMGIRVRGVHGEMENRRYGVVDFVEPMDPRNVILGRELAYALHVDPDFFEKVRLIYPLGEVSPSGEMLPAVRSLTVGGTFRSGYYEYDSKFALIDYEEALRLFGEEARTGLEIWTQQTDHVALLKRRLEDSFHSLPLQIETWQEQNPKLFAALKLERIGMFLLLVVLLAIASVTVFGLVSLLVLEKMRDIAVIRTLGLGKKRVRRLFLLQALGIGLLGDLVGGGIALGLVRILVEHPLRLPSTYYVEYLPLDLSFGTALWVLGLAPLLAILAALYPAWQSVQHPPTELLRYE